MLKLKSRGSKEINGKETPIMIWQNQQTGGELVTYLVRQTPDHKWWAFEDLYQLPMMRYIAAKKVLELYGHGLSLDDIKGITGVMKGILKSDDKEKYEKAYAKVLELESLTESFADPIKQSLGLCTVYLLLDDEPPDVWTNQVSSLKMGILALDVESQAFFLNWWASSITHYGQGLKGLSAIVSKMSEFGTGGVPNN